MTKNTPFLPQQFELCPSVLMVNGHKAACIYDLRLDNAKLYKLDDEARDIVNHIIDSTYSDKVADDNYHSIFSFLMKNNLIQKSTSNKEVESHSENNLLKEKSIKKRAWIEITSRCQLKCIYCYGEFGQNQGISLTNEDATTIAKELEINGFNDFQLIGGEPLVEKRFIKVIVKRLRKIKNADIEIFTNGILINEDFITFCEDNRIRLAVTVFGANENECRAVTGVRGIFEKQKKALSKLHSNKVDFRLSVTRTNANNSSTLNDILNALDMEESTIINEDIARPAGRATNDVLISDELLQQRLIIEDTFKRSLKSKTVRRNMNGNSCFSDKVCITTELDVFPCVMERSTIYGNIKHRPLSNILTNSKCYSLATKDSIDVCKDCEYRYACFDCRPLRKTGDFFSQPSNCTYNPYNATWKK